MSEKTFSSLFILFLLFPFYRLHAGLLTLVELEQLLVMSCLTALTIQVNVCCNFVVIFSKFHLIIAPR